jgi:tetratricopeptide (TPR) repeat protein
MKKILIILFIVAIIAVATIPMWTTMMAEKAFEKPTRSDSPEMVNNAIKLKMYFYMYAESQKIAEKAIIYFPESSYFPNYIYSAALCAERDKNINAAIHWYEYFIDKYPKHTWIDQAKNNLIRLNALHKI